LLTKNEVEKLIRSYIEKTETLGEQIGGSGHLGYIGYNLLDFKFEHLPAKHWKVIFKYILSIETEFTYEPDNPPMQTEYEKEIIINDHNEVISERTISEKSNWLNEELLNPLLEDEKIIILKFIEELLAKIEWRYGDSRAPIKYPPKFSEEEGKYICKVELEDDAGELIFDAEDPHSLTQKVIDDLRKRFYPI